MNTKIVYAAGIVIIIIGIIFYFSTYVYNSPTNNSPGPETQTIQSASDSPDSSNPSPQTSNNNNGNLGQQQALSSSAAQSNYQNLSLSINSIEMVPSNSNNNNVSNLQIAMDVYNPNRGSAILETLSYNVFLDDVRLSSGDMGTRTEGFVDSLESVYTIIGNQTITLRDKTPLSAQGQSLIDSGLSVAPVSDNNLSSQPSQSLTTNTTTTLPSDSYLVNGTYFFTLNRGSQAQSSEFPFSLQFPAK